MSKHHRHVETAEVYTMPSALILGVDGVCEQLSAALREYGCRVEIRGDYLSEHDVFDYVFQFGKLYLCEEVRERHLKPRGKFLFIETEKDESGVFDRVGWVRILRVGPTHLWSVTDLSELIMTTMFTADEHIIDRRKSVHPTHTPDEPVAPPTLQAPHPPRHAAKTLQQIPPPASVPVAELVVHKKHRVRRAFFYLGMVCLIVVLAAGIGGYWFVRSLNSSFSAARSHLASSDWKGLQEDIGTIRGRLVLAERVYGGIYTILFPFRESAAMKDADDVLRLSRRLLDSGEEAFTFFQTFSFSKTGAFGSDIFYYSKH